MIAEPTKLPSFSRVGVFFWGGGLYDLLRADVCLLGTRAALDNMDIRSVGKLLLN